LLRQRFLEPRAKEDEAMNSRMNWLLGAGLGAAAMYYFDPARGRYRRGLVRNQLVHAARKAQRGASITNRDFRNRSSGALAGLRSLLDFSQPDDVVLEQRVRACLGRVVAHPSSVEVTAQDGVVTLSGPILADEVRLLVDCVHHVRGVREVREELDVHAEPGNIPGLQGSPPQRPNARVARENWSPSARAASGIGGAVAVLCGLSARHRAAPLLSAAGLLLSTRALTNMPMRRLIGIGTGRNAVHVRKSIRIHASVEEVFRLWASFDRLPGLMTHVRRVRRVGTSDNQDRWRWTIRGKPGVQVEYDSVVTAREENRLLAWRTEDGGLLRHAGRVMFRPNDDGSTTVDVSMVYNPVAGALGHALAWLIGMDPKSQMDDDLLRMKTYLETGRRPRDAADAPEPRHVSPNRERPQFEARVGSAAEREPDEPPPAPVRH
jgi:uncharacterized membrane protein